MSLEGLLKEPDVTYAMEAHDGMSARIAEGAGFPVLWASGLCISTSCGVRDSNEISWSNMLDRVRSISLCTNLPILVDGDSGHGNYNSARVFARHAQESGAQGVCYEDKQFPKMNSFYGDAPDLIETREFMVKIAAAREVVEDDFMIVARTESLIAGAGVDEALERGRAYIAAGANALFIHSRQEEVNEIAEFCRRWDRCAPLVIAPTTYGRDLDPQAFEELGVSMVIWANQSLRAAYKAMEKVACHLSKNRSLVSLPEMIQVQEIFEHYAYPEMDEAERRLVGFVESCMEGSVERSVPTNNRTSA
ncbi:isocitrate lyase/phosphoenolpyruvate mutase family protein [Kocuria sp.]|uniref:isocitrate lyase/phosphoenolpyruvate mutase family protein n=1 Tax=Kocuria sp. TaxID=1871328 RepID=UPI0026E03841|nr:isocitrate lyase/phosphoenolpyruvate mutase family protein [Kocuria sp.]MDO5618535.1 isocitrate lyase/phosphoenolpyruvate mutase family protein [Kocuria sp.]